MCPPPLQGSHKRLVQCIERHTLPSDSDSNLIACMQRTTVTCKMTCCGCVWTSALGGGQWWDLVENRAGQLTCGARLGGWAHRVHWYFDRRIATIVNDGLREPIWNPISSFHETNLQSFHQSGPGFTKLQVPRKICDCCQASHHQPNFILGLLNCRGSFLHLAVTN